MTKTELKLLEMVKTYGRGVVTTTYGRGPRGGKVSTGFRERDAMYKLQIKGLIVIVAREPWQDHKRGNMQSGNTFVFEMI